MSKRTRLSSVALAERSLMPSPASLGFCLLVGVIIMGLHILIAATNSRALLPNFLDGQWAHAYGVLIKEPLAALLARSSVRGILLIALCGLIGLSIYTIVEHGIKNYREWREAEKDVQVINPENIVPHPAQRQFLINLVWRSGVCCALAIWLIIVLVLAHQMVAYPMSLPSIAGLRSGFFRSLLLVGLEWMLLTHVLVVILRLSARRTRLFTKHMPTQELTFFHS